MSKDSEGEQNTQRVVRSVIITSSCHIERQKLIVDNSLIAMASRLAEVRQNTPYNQYATSERGISKNAYRQLCRYGTASQNTEERLYFYSKSQNKVKSSPIRKREAEKLNITLPNQNRVSIAVNNKAFGQLKQIAETEHTITVIEKWLTTQILTQVEGEANASPKPLIKTCDDERGKQKWQVKREKR